MYLYGGTDKQTERTIGYYSASEKKQSNDRHGNMEESHINHALQSQIQKAACCMSINRVKRTASGKLLQGTRSSAQSSAATWFGVGVGEGR